MQNQPSSASVSEEQGQRKMSASSAGSAEAEAQESQLQEQKLANTRVFMYVASVNMFLSDCVLMYPKFTQKTFFPNQLGIILAGVVAYPCYLMLLMSHRKK